MARLTWIVYGYLLTEQISIMTLSSILKKRGVDSTLIYTDKPKEIIERLKELKPDMVAYSLMYGSHRRYVDISKEIKKQFPHIYQIAGGPYTTYFPESIEELSLDAICVGDGDVSLPNFVEAKLTGKPVTEAEGFHVRNNGHINKKPVGNLLEELDSLPFPDRELFYAQDTLLRNQEFKSFISGRGCPYLCNYCFNHKFNEMYKGKGKIIRKKSVDYFVEEIKETKVNYGCQYAIFEDDIFIFKKDWFEEFARKFKKEVGIPYICYARPNLIDETSVKLLAESGCHIVRMAIETGNEQIREKVLQRKMDNETIIRASDLIHSAGLKLSVSNMIGLPTETLENVYETVDLNIRCQPDHPTAQFFMPYPGMELTKIAISTGHFDNGMFGEINKNTWKTSPLKFDAETKRKMEKIQKIFPLVVRYPFLKNYYSLLFMIPSILLYYISMFAKIVIVVGYFPPAKVSLVQRLRVLRRFFSFYS